MSKLHQPKLVLEAPRAMKIARFQYIVIRENRAALIWVSTVSFAQWHICRMMSQESCARNALVCEESAAHCLNPAHIADWLEMARCWRAMSSDPDGQATIAWLMNLELEK